MKDYLNILAFTNGTTSRKWRFDGIANRINQNNQGEMFVAPYKTWNGDIIGADLVVVEMLTGEKLIEDCHKQGAKVIYEGDDAVIDTYGKERKNLMHIDGAWKASAIKTIEMCDAVTVTCDTLAKNYARFTNKPIYVLPNYVDFDWYGKEDLNIIRNSDEIRLGWFGSKGHYEDLKWLTPVIGRILDKYPKVKFVYAGFGGMSSDKAVTEIGWGEDVFKELPRTRREYVGGVGEDFWPMKHRLLDFDIGMAPLLDDYFNHCKSPIKWMEYSILGTPVVCSSTVYAENPFGKGQPVVAHGRNGFIAKTEEEWFKYLSMLVEDATLRKNMAAAAKRSVMTHWDLDKHWTKWLNVYREIYNAT